MASGFWIRISDRETEMTFKGQPGARFVYDGIRAWQNVFLFNPHLLCMQALELIYWILW